MNTKQDVTQAVTMCQSGVNTLRDLAMSESSQTCKHILLDAAHHLEVAATECNYALKNL